MLQIAKYDRPQLTVTGDSAAEIQRFHDAAARRSLWCRGSVFDAASLEWRSQCNKGELALAARIIDALNAAGSATVVAAAARPATWRARTVERFDTPVPTPQTLVRNGETLRFTGYGRSWIYPEDGTGDPELEGQEVRYAYYA